MNFFGIKPECATEVIRRSRKVCSAIRDIEVFVTPSLPVLPIASPPFSLHTHTHLHNNVHAFWDKNENVFFVFYGKEDSIKIKRPRVIRENAPHRHMHSRW